MMQNSAIDTASDKASGIYRVIAVYWEKLLFLLPNLLLAFFILIATFWLAGKVKQLISQRLSGKAKDEITTHYIARISKWVLVMIGLLLVLQTLGLSGMAGGILASAGISVVVLGFAFRDIAENFLAGLILAFNRPFEEGDMIEVKDMIGKVVSLNIRTTHLLTSDSRDIYVPNGIILTSSVTNFTHNGLVRLDFTVGIDYRDSVERAIELIEKTVKGMEGVLEQPSPFVTVHELSTSSLYLNVYFWATSIDYNKSVTVVRGSVMQAVNKALLAGGFSTPSTIQELKLYDYQKEIPVRVINQAKSEEKQEG